MMAGTCGVGGEWRKEVADQYGCWSCRKGADVAAGYLLGQYHDKEASKKRRRGLGEIVFVEAVPK